MSHGLKTVLNKPWLPGQADEDLFNGSTFAVATPKVGLRIFFFIITALFLLFISSYRLRMGYEDWVPVPKLWQLWLNTAFIIGSSVALQWACSAATKSNLRSMAVGLYVGGFFTLAFLGGQLWVWSELVGLGYYLSGNPANSFFYLITAVHGVHLLGGLVAWLRTAVKLHTGTDISAVRMSLELCTVYWHYLLVVWAVLFYMLLST